MNSLDLFDKLFIFGFAALSAINFAMCCHLMDKNRKTLEALDNIEKCLKAIQYVIRTR